MDDLMTTLLRDRGILETIRREMESGRTDVEILTAVREILKIGK